MTSILSGGARGTRPVRPGRCNPPLRKSALFELALLVCGLFLPSLITFLSPPPAQAQSQSWKVEERESSQRDTSLAITQLAHWQVDAAVSSLLKATGEDASDPLPFAVLGLALDMKGSYREALDALQKSWQLNSHNEETALSVGVTHYLMRDYDKALAAWQKALELNPKLCHINGDIGYAYLRKADFAKAEESFRRLISCFPNSQFAYQGVATIHYLTGDFAGSRQAAEHAQAISSYPPAILLLAKLDILQGDRARAIKHIAEYIAATKKPGWQRSMTAIGYPVQHDFKWDPFLADNLDNAYLLQSRALNLPRESSRQKSLARQGQADALIARAKDAYAQAPSDYILARELGLLELARGDYSDAAEHFKQELSICRDCNVDLLHLGRALSLDCKAGEASEAVRRFQQRYPNCHLPPVFADIARVDPAVPDVGGSSAR